MKITARDALLYYIFWERPDIMYVLLTGWNIDCGDHLSKDKEDLVLYW